MADAPVGKISNIGAMVFIFGMCTSSKKVRLDTMGILVGSRERAMDRSTLLNIPFVGEEVVIERQHFTVVEHDYQVVP